MPRKCNFVKKFHDVHSEHSDHNTYDDTNQHIHTNTDMNRILLSSQKLPEAKDLT
jgi:hypothetical protein